MSINANCIDAFVLPSTSDAAYLKTVCSGILHFSGEKSPYSLEGMPFFPMTHVDGGVQGIISPGKLRGAQILLVKAVHSRHCVMIVAHSVSVLL